MLIAVGASGRKASHSRRRLPEALVNTDFLRDVRLGAAPDFTRKRAMVLGGGNVAMDWPARRSASAAKVDVACLESREKMPAHRVGSCCGRIRGNRAAPRRFVREPRGQRSRRRSGAQVKKVARMEFDSDGRLTLETEPGTEHAIACDVVIFSVGQRPDLALIREASGIGVTRRQTIAVNEAYAAFQPGIFAAGDVVTGTSFVIDAVAAGHKSALSIHQYLRGLNVEPARKPAIPVARMEPAELAARVRSGEVRRSPRVPLSEADVARRILGFEEVETGYTEEQARAEANRCLSCGVCSECLSCSYECKAGAIQHDEEPRDTERASGRGGAGAGVSGVPRGVERGVRARALSECRYVAAVRTAAKRVGTDARPRAAALRRKARAQDRLSAMHRLARPAEGLLLGGVLHVRGQGSDYGAGARPGGRSTVFFMDTARVQQRLQRLLQAGARTLRRGVRAVQGLVPERGPRRPGRFWCGTCAGMTARPAQRLRT